MFRATVAKVMFLYRELLINKTFFQGQSYVRHDLKGQAVASNWTWIPNNFMAQ